MYFNKPVAKLRKVSTNHKVYCIYSLVGLYSLVKVKKLAV